MRISIFYRGMPFWFNHKESDQVQGDFEIYNITTYMFDAEEILEAYRTDFDRECNKLIKNENSHNGIDI